MARDVSESNKVQSSSTSTSTGQKNNSNYNSNKSPPILDQKVPPLRIVLNTGTQKSNQDSKSNSDQNIQLKVGNKVRIKLGNNAQQEPPPTKEDKEPVIYSHLRRITRRSQRTVQVVTNEDEESMTSLDENLTNTNINTNSNPSTNTNDGNNEVSSPPRRYKRRKCETFDTTTQSTPNDYDAYDYKPPNQNSFELYKNIRRQVDDKLRNLNIVQPRVPFGLKDYLTTRGAYLLDGNKLGNGTNLYHGLRNHGKSQYDVPNRAKVPLGLPVSSPLYNLFIEQEKERFKMRMQHLKEREKLTLATEQEIMRVYSKAALTAANQDEPFSACTMLKHQEIYNSFDNTNLPSMTDGDSEPERSRRERVRTRRRNAEAAFAAAEAAEAAAAAAAATQATTSAPEPGASGQNKQDVKQSAQEQQSEDGEASLAKDESTSVAPSEEVKDSKQESSKSSTIIKTESSDKIDTLTQPGSIADSEPPDSDQMDLDNRLIIDDNKDEDDEDDEGDDVAEGGAKNDSEHSNDCDNNKSKNNNKNKNESDSVDSGNTTTKTNDVKPDVTKTIPTETKDKNDDDAEGEQSDNKHDSSTSKPMDSTGDSENPVTENSNSSNPSSSKADHPADEPMDTEFNNEQGGQDKMNTDDQQQDQLQQSQESSVEDLEEKQNRELEIFITQLHDIDDKWEQVRKEMLIRHRNEAESLHAVQSLEWEWKTKEIGLCDVRNSLPIDSTLVPKLDINMQDY